MTRTLCISSYALSAPFRRSLTEGRVGEIEYRIVSDLRAMHPIKMMRTLRQPRVSLCILAIEDAEAVAVLPALRVIAGLSGAREVAVARRAAADAGVLELVEAPSLAFSVIGMMVGSLRGWLALLRVWITAAALERLAPKRFQPRGREFLFLNTNLWFGIKAGGAIGHIAGVINGFSRLGWSTRYVSVAEGIMLDDSVREQRLPALRQYGMPAEVNHYRFGVAVTANMRRMPDQARPSLIYQRMTLGNVSGVVLSRAWKVPLVVEYNGSHEWIGRNWGRGLRFEAASRACENASLRHASWVMTVSKVLADELIARGVPCEKVVWYPNGVDERVFDETPLPASQSVAVRRRFGFEDDAILVTFLGTFGRWHGVESLASAIEQLCEQDAEWLASRRVRFAIVGDGTTMTAVRATLERALARRIVVLPGLIPQALAPEVLRASDLLLSPHVRNPDGSAFFGSPTKLFEYMAVGKPIIASRLDQIEDVLSPGLDAAELGLPAASTNCVNANAIFVPPGDVPALARAIKELIDAPEVRGIVGRNAARTARARYLWSHHVTHLLAEMSAE